MAKIIISILLFVGLALSSCDFASNFCAASGLTCPTNSNSITVNGNAYSTGDFGIISFNDLTITHGDIQERAAVRNNFYGNKGISVADNIVNNKEYSLIVGGNVYWNDNGAIVGNIFGNAVNIPSSISGSVTAGCSSSGCLDSDFSNIQNYWTQFSSNVALQNSNVDVTFDSGVATLSCQSSANVYYVRFSPDTFNSVVGYQVSSSCSGSASWVFNIIGNSDVYFGGNPIQISGPVIYNIAPAGQVIVGSSVNGNIVAPYATLNMVGGTITGQIIANNISNIIQVNIPTSCSSGTSSSTSSSSGNSGSVGTSSSSTSTSTSSDASNSGITDENSQSTPGTNNEQNSGSLITYSVILVILTFMLI